MDRRRFVTAATLAAAALAVPLAGAQTLPANKLVMQVSDNDPAKWNLALNNAKNVQTDLGAQNVVIEIVAYGPGINMLKADSVAANRVAEAMGAGVMVIACENTMTNQKLDKNSMMNGIGYVKAGVVEIMQKQQAGWAYLRP
ncbi:MAG TPA: DsrE family protein [Casimicrobiaceae bacterium]|jgi:hypothetical protein